MGDLSYVGDLIVPGIIFALSMFILAWVPRGVGTVGRREGAPPAAFVGAVRESRFAFAAAAIAVRLLILVAVAVVVLLRSN